MGHFSGIGGWQLYCDARIVYLTELGYEVYFINDNSFTIDNIKIDTFKHVNYIDFKELYFSPYIYTKNQISNVNSKISNRISFADGDKVFVESTSIQQALWGEIIAEAFSGIHFSYLLHSHFDNIHKSVKKFFLFKYSQDLLGGMTNKTVPNLLNDLESIPPDKANGMSALSRGPLIESDEYDLYIKSIKERLGEKSYIIGYFGTLSKPHFIPLCDKLTLFFNKYSNYKFCFLSIGSSSNGEAEHLQNQIALNCKNVICKNVPELFPVPRALFRAMDLCIGSWGSSRIAAKAGAKTLRLIDDKSVEPQGLIGITLIKEPYHEIGSEKYDFLELLEDYLIKRKYDGYDYYPPSPDEPDFRFVHRKNDEIIKPFIERPRCHEYYNTRKIKNTTSKWIVIKICNYILGKKITNRIIDTIRHHK